MKKAFTLVEVLIVVAILGILAAITLPTFKVNIQRAREAAAKDNLRMLRNAIELYAVQHHGDPPGYYNGAVADEGVVMPQLTKCSNPDGLTTNSKIPTGQFTLGPYLNEYPENPFNHDNNIYVLFAGEDFPEEAEGHYGYYYSPSMRQIRLDYPGTDSQGVEYYSY